MLPDAVGTNGTAGRERIAAAFERALATRVGSRSSRNVVSRATRMPTPASRSPSPRPMHGADLLEIGLPYSDPLADGATLQRASGAALRAGATLERSLRLIERIGAARPTCRSCRWATPTRSSAAATARPVARRLAGAGAAGLIVADLTPDEGRPFEAVARAAELAVVYLVAPTTSPARGDDRRPQRRLPVLRLARRGDRGARPRCRGPWAASSARSRRPRRSRSRSASA